MSRNRLSFTVALLLGAAIWWVSPYFTSEVEAWDAKGCYYPLSLFLAATLASLISPDHFWISALGVYIGQFVYALFFLPGGFIWIIGMMYGGIWFFVSLYGAFCGYALARTLRHFRGRVER
jgi:hypothetical protein